MVNHHGNNHRQYAAGEAAHLRKRWNLENRENAGDWRVTDA